MSILSERGRKPTVVMQLTGTCGDAVRYQCHQRGLTVHMMPPKHTHDFAEVFDGVPSMHDAKAAVVLAKLQAIHLKEKSSGNVNGRLMITKRGPGEVRHLLYLAALRMLRHVSTIPRAWYRARESQKAKQSLKAVVALMRKLARALWHVGRGAMFDPTRLFDTRRLGLSADALAVAKEITASSLAMASTPATTCEGGAALL